MTAHIVYFYRWPVKAKAEKVLTDLLLLSLQVCPMNTSPYVDPSKSSQEIWEEFSMSFTPAVREVVEFAKRTPGFRDLPEHDQVSLLKAGTFEVRAKKHKHTHVILCSL